MENSLFSPWEKVMTISGNVWYINSVNHFKWYTLYSVWDWNKDFLTMDEWALKKYEEDKIWFTESCEAS